MELRKTNIIALLAMMLTLSLAPLVYADDDDDDDEISIEIDQASYQKKRNRLRVKGELDDNEGRTRVELWDPARNLLLASKNVREDFNFRINLDDDLPVPCRIEIRAADKAKQKPVRKAPSDCGLYRTTLSGLVTDGPIPFATVSVTVNGQTYTTVADENGFYSLDILSASLDELVTIEAEAENATTGDPINFVNLAGTFSKIVEQPDANVTNVSTAKYTLLLEATGGAPPTNEQQLREAETSVDATELLQLSAVIKLIVDDPLFSLPEGFTNIVDFVQDEAAVDTFIEEVAALDNTALDNAVADILGDSDLVAGFVAADIPSQYYSVPVVNPGYISRSGDVLEFDQNGTGTRLAYQEGAGQAINEAFTWEVNKGRLELTFLNPIQREAGTDDFASLTSDQSLIDEYNARGGTLFDNGFIPFITTNISESYTRIDDGALVDTVNVEDRVRVEVPPIPMADGGPDFIIPGPTFDIASSNGTLRSSEDVQNIPFTTSCNPGEVCALGLWGGLFHYTPAFPRRFGGGAFLPNTAYGDAITFNADGTATGAISGETANWVVDPMGRLVVTYADGLVQTSELVDNLGLEYGAVTFFENGPERFATYRILVRGDSNATVTDSSIVSTTGKYWNGEVNVQIPGSFDENGLRRPFRRFGWRFFADSSLNNERGAVFDFDGDSVDDNVLFVSPTQGYSVINNVVQLERFSFATRFWYPINTTTDNGDRVIYVMEFEVRDEFEECQQFGQVCDPRDSLLFPARINIQREINEFNDWDFTVINDPR